MQNSESEIDKIAELTYNLLSSRFLLNENVLIPSLDDKYGNISGKIVKCNKDCYVIQMTDNNKVDVPLKEIKRKTNFTASDIYSFIEAITIVTPLGRIVIENVFEKITQAGFGLKKTSLRNNNANANTNNHNSNYNSSNVNYNNISNGNYNNTANSNYNSIYNNNYSNNENYSAKYNSEENTKGLQRRPEKGSNLSSVFQSVEIRNQLQKPIVKKIEEVPVEIKTENFKKIEIPGVEGKNLQILIKIFTFVSAFKQDPNINKIKKFNIETINSKTNSEKVGNINLIDEIKIFSEELTDPEYANETIFNLHKFFIEAIEKDISNSGYRFVNELFLLINRLPVYVGAPVKEQKKKRAVMDKENWKIQVKNFICNFSSDVNSEKPLRFLDFQKKESAKADETDNEKESEMNPVQNENKPVDINTINTINTPNIKSSNINLKLEFLDFLFKVFTYTETARTIIYLAVNNSKIIKSLKFKEDDQMEDSSGNNDQQAFFLDNPLMANIGKFRNFIIFLSNRNILLGDKFEYFILDQKDSNMILKELNGLSKAEKSTMNNLRSIFNELF